MLSDQHTGCPRDFLAENQRIAIVRGWSTVLQLIAAPLDGVRSLTVIRIVYEMATKFGAVIVVTHDEKIMPTFKRVHRIRDRVTHNEAGEGFGFEQAQLLEPDRRHSASREQACKGREAMSSSVERRRITALGFANDRRKPVLAICERRDFN